MLNPLFPKAPVVLTPLSRPPALTWSVPGSKSITNRALVLAALAEGETRLTGVLESDDTRHMKHALRALGIAIEELDETSLLVHGGRSRLRTPEKPLFVGNSGTTVRFLTALACLVPGAVTLEGDEHMQRRPIVDLVDGLRQLGAEIECPTGCPPLRVRQRPLSGRRVVMRGDRSSQYFSALLMAAAGAGLMLDIEIEGELVSRPYVALTQEMIRTFGGETLTSASGFRVTPGSYRGQAYAIEPDASSASYAFAMAAATGGSVTVPGLGTNSQQGDYGFVEVLESMGANVERTATETHLVGGPLRGVDVDMHHISDTVMTLAAIAPVCAGNTRIRNVANIRIKETDRLAATVAELERLGQAVSSGDDWLAIEPRPVQPATIECYSDHRMAMAFSLLGLMRSGVSISDPACVAKTYPSYWRDLARVYQAAGDAVPFRFV